MVTVQREIRKRGFFGKLIKLLFVLFNVLMVVWLVSYWMKIGAMTGGSMTEAERVGAGLGSMMGTGFLLFVWLVGAVILGLLTLLTRGQRLLITEER